MNQYMNVPSGGIILGYFFVACAAFCSSVIWGPAYWYRGGPFEILEPWEGGLNLAGFSRTRGFPGFAFVVALRTNWFLQIAPVCGRRNLGIVAILGGIVGSDRCDRSWDAVCCRPLEIEAIHNFRYGDLDTVSDQQRRCLLPEETRQLLLSHESGDHEYPIMIRELPY